MKFATDPATFRRLYGDLTKANPMWKQSRRAGPGLRLADESTYIAEPPFFEGFTMKPGAMPGISGARALGIFGDSVTTDHISPAGSIKPVRPPASTCRSTA